MVTRSEPFLLPLFFTFCVHLSFFVLLSYWGDWELPGQNTLGPSISVALRNLPPSPVPNAPSKAAASRPTPPAEKKKEKKAESSVELPDKRDEKNLDRLIDNLRESELQKEEKEKQVPQEEEPAAEKQPSVDESQTAHQQKMRNEALVYYQRNKELVERNFNLGTTAQQKQFQGLVTRIKIFLDDGGRLVNVEILTSSGNEAFDIEAERAVKRVRSFIIPSDKRLQKNYFREIVMEFTLPSGR